jgi:hypothetical protein
MKNRIRLLVAAAGASLASTSLAQTIQWAAAVDGSWTTAASWNPANIPDGAAETAVLGLSTAYSVTLSGSFPLSRLTISNPLAVLNIQAGSNLQPNAVTNDGRITLRGAPCCTIGALTVASGSSLDGSGRIVLDNSAGGDAQLKTSSGIDPAFIGPDMTITGSGSIPGYFINSGTIAGSGGTGPVVTGRIENDDTGKLSAVGFQRRVSIGAGTVVGGTMESSGGGSLGTTGSGFLSGPTLSTGSDFYVFAGHRLTVLPPGMTNDGRFTILGAPCCTLGFLTISTGATMSGAGFVTLDNSPGGNAILEGSGTATLGDGVTVNGNGQINGALINRGTIAGGDGTGPVINALFTNQGPGGLRVSGVGQTASIGTGTIIGGILASSDGGRIAVEDNGFVRNLTIESGSDVHVLPGSRLTVQAPGITHKGRVTIFGAPCCTIGFLTIADGATISAAPGSPGFITLNNQTGGNAQLDTVGLASIGAGITVNGIGRVAGAYLNSGTFAGGPGTGPVIDGTVTNQPGGKLRAEGAGQTVSIGGGAISGGTLESANGGRVATAGNGFVEGSTLTAGSTLHVLPGNRLTVLPGGLVVNGQVSVFGAPCCTIGYLTLADTAALSGSGTITLDHRTGGETTLDTANGGSDLGTIGQGVRIEGLGIIGGRFNVAGTIAPGLRFGQLARPGNLSLTTTAAIEIEIGGPGNDRRDSLVGNGVLNLSGTLRVRFLDGYRLPPCSSYVPISGGQVRGRFTALDLPRGMQAIYAADRVTLYYNPADFDGNGQIDFFDYLDFANAFSSDDPAADYDGNGQIDFFDYLEFAQDFSSGC